MSASVEDVRDKQVVAIRPAACAGNQGVRHAIRLRLADESDLSADEALALMDAGVILYMIPPESAPAHAAHKATGLPLMLQARECEFCKKRVLFA